MGGGGRGDTMPMAVDPSLVGCMARVSLVTGEERLGVVCVVDPVSGGLVLATKAADGAADGGATPGVVVVMGHAIRSVMKCAFRS